MLDRSKPPLIKVIDQLNLPKTEKHQLDNGIPVYEVNLGTQQVVKVEFIFSAGRPFEDKRLASRATLGLLKEGTKNHSAEAIAEQLDFYGSSLSFPFNLDTSNIILYSLNRHLEKSLAVVAELLLAPQFPEQELSNFIKRNQQQLQLDLAKNDVVAYRTITEQLFGADHPYGYNSLPETYATLERTDLIKHFQKCYNAANCVIFISGLTNPNMIKLLNQYLGQMPLGKPLKAQVPSAVPQVEKKTVLSIPDSIQTAIRLGRPLFGRTHADYKKMYVLNTILGGYFGSRLMANIREEKGYTYNIYSIMDVMRYDGCLYIGAEVGNDFVAATLEEMYLEIERLQNELVGPKEMDMVRNYLLGNFLSMLDGPFNVSEIIKTIVMEQLSWSYFDELVETIKTIRPQDILELAQQYLQRDQLWELVVGQ